MSAHTVDICELSLDDGENLISLLECPVCLEVMVPPISMCENGHNMCAKCKTNDVNTCPTCRGKFISTRNLVLETMANRARRPCNNISSGCSEKFTLEKMAEHARICPHRLYECILSGCSWKGRRGHIKNHFKDNHKGSIFEMKSELFLNYKKICLSNDCNFTYLFVKFDELFWYRSWRNSVKKTLFEVVQYIGPQENASKYRYELILESKSSDQIIRINNVVRSDTEDVESILNSRDCFAVDFEMLKKFIDNGNFSYKIKVMKNI